MAEEGENKKTEIFPSYPVCSLIIVKWKEGGSICKLHVDLVLLDHLHFGAFILICVCSGSSENNQEKKKTLWMTYMAL